MQALLETKGLGKEFPSRSGPSVVAVQDVTLTIPKEQILCIVGPSGCGKSTLLDMFAGFSKPTHGTIEVEGAPVTAPSPELGFVFQQAVLFPWLSVLDNILLGPKSRGADMVETQAQADRVLKSVGLTDFRNHFPYQLSGGMRQRAQIARVLVASPSVILMDEPFGALDAQTRSAMHELLLDVWEEYKPTIVFITHDVDEALFLADRVLVMSHRPGRIKSDMTVNFERPRRLDLITDPEFAKQRAEIISLLRHHEAEAEIEEAGQ